MNVSACTLINFCNLKNNWEYLLNVLYKLEYWFKVLLKIFSKNVES